MVEPRIRDAVISKKILKEIDDIYIFTDAMTEDGFFRDVKTQKAVIMSLINIGELSKNLSDTFICSNIKIPWKKLQAMRNVAAHAYELIDMQIVWNTIKISIAELKKELTD